ncbi:VLN1, partial [Linum grandiflorum]
PSVFLRVLSSPARGVFSQALPQLHEKASEQQQLYLCCSECSDRWLLECRSIGDLNFTRRRRSKRSSSNFTFAVPTVLTGGCLRDHECELMALYAKGIDSVFQTAGTKPGIEIWCVEKLQLVSLPKSLLGKFYYGNAYVVLNTIVNRNGISLHDIHYWIGKDATEEESTLASDKALELDQALGSCTVQYREVQGQETEKFLAYFKPCMIPIEGVFSSEPGRRGGEGYKVTLLSCKGEHVVSVKEVPFARSSLTHNDVFILDTASKIFLFSGCNSSIQERAKASEVVHYVNENKHGGNCDVATIEDGKLVGDPDVGEFWSLFGGYAPIPKDSTSVVQQQCDTTSPQLFWITTQGKLRQIESSSLNKQLLESNKCYMVDCGAEIFVWMGKTTLITERKTSISAIEVRKRFFYFCCLFNFHLFSLKSFSTTSDVYRRTANMN